MSTVVSLVNSTPLYGGISDGYRRSQLGNPTGTVGQPPKFRGEVNKPGSDVKAPKILSSAARQNRATNVTIPYARVCSSEDLVNKGRLSPGDVAFISRYQHGLTGQARLNHAQKRQIITSASTPHANISRLVGLDYVNRGLGPDNYKAGSTVLVNSSNPLDDWRSLSFLNEFTPDGVILSNDSPGYTESTSSGVRNDQIFNVGIQGPVQLNNGYEDDIGRGVAIHYDRANALAAGNMGPRVPDGMTRKEASKMTAESLIGGPFYSQYPIQMFDRKIRPLSDLYIGLICKKIEGAELENIRNMRSTYKEDFAKAEFIHVFEYRCFSSRQIYQFATDGDNPDGDPDFDIVDTGRAGRGPGGKRNGNNDYNLGEAEPADRRRGPNDPKRGRNDEYLPRKSDKYEEEDSFLGIKRVEVKHMVGAWRIGKVLDVASQRQQGYNSGPVDTPFSVTLNFDLSFLDWRQLRRNFTMNIFGYELDLADNVGGTNHWKNFGLKSDGQYRFDGDYGRVLQWPTVYMLPNEDDNIPFNPTMTYVEFDQATQEYHKYRWKEDPQIQRTKYKKSVEASAGEGATFAKAKPVLAPVPGQSQLEPQQTLVSPAPAPSPSAFPEVSAPAASLSFPEQTTRAPAPTPTPTPTPTPKAASKAPMPVAAPPEPMQPPAKAPPKAASKSTAKKPAAASAIGDQVLANIFGSAMPGADVGVSGDDAASDARSDTSAQAAEKPRSFPRRRDR